MGMGYGTRTSGRMDMDFALAQVLRRVVEIRLC